MAKRYFVTQRATTTTSNTENIKHNYGQQILVYQIQRQRIFQLQEDKPCFFCVVGTMQHLSRFHAIHAWFPHILLKSWGEPCGGRVKTPLRSYDSRTSGDRQCLLTRNPINSSNVGIHPTHRVYSIHKMEKNGKQIEKLHIGKEIILYSVLLSAKTVPELLQEQLQSSSSTSCCPPYF